MRGRTIVTDERPVDDGGGWVASGAETQTETPDCTERLPSTTTEGASYDLSRRLLLRTRSLLGPAGESPLLSPFANTAGDVEVVITLTNVLGEELL